MRFITIVLVIMMTVGPAQAKSQWTVAVLIDNSSTTPIEAREDAIKNIHKFLGELAKLRSRRTTRDIQIIVVLTTIPNRISWMGSPADLRKDAQKVMHMTEFRETCSDLELGFEEIETAITINPPERLDIFTLSPLINVPFSICEENPTVNLPQEVPNNLLLGKLASRAVSTNLFLVNDDQKRNYLDYMRGLGLQGSFDIRGMIETSARLSKGEILR